MLSRPAPLTKQPPAAKRFRLNGALPAEQTSQAAVLPRLARPYMLTDISRCHPQAFSPSHVLRRDQ